MRPSVVFSRSASSTAGGHAATEIGQTLASDWQVYPGIFVTFPCGIADAAKIHHLATQRDNRLTQQINDYTSQVAMQTQRDGASMFTIAVVTAIFLPGTFVAASLPFDSPLAWQVLTTNAVRSKHRILQL
jgi:hypothetical protein